MAIMDNYAAVCRSRATNPEYPLELIESLQKEFKKGMEVGFIDPLYLLEKLDALTRHVEWCREVGDQQSFGDA